MSCLVTYTVGGVCVCVQKTSHVFHFNQNEDYKVFVKISMQAVNGSDFETRHEEVSGEFNKNKQCVITSTKWE